MVETKHRFFGQHIAETIRDVRLILGIDRKSPRPEFILSPEERVELELETETILEKEDFGREDFGDFCKNMIVLARREGLPGNHAILHDIEGRTLIDIFEGTISVRVYPDPKDNSSESGSLSQTVTYEPQKIDQGFLHTSVSDFKPVLSTIARVPVPSTIMFYSFFSGKSEQAFYNGRSRVNREVIVSDIEVQDFCVRVFGVYTKNKEAAVTSPQQ